MKKIKRIQEGLKGTDQTNKIQSQLEQKEPELDVNSAEYKLEQLKNILDNGIGNLFHSFVYRKDDVKTSLSKVKHYNNFLSLLEAFVDTTSAFKENEFKNPINPNDIIQLNNSVYIWPPKTNPYEPDLTKEQYIYTFIQFVYDMVLFRYTRRVLEYRDDKNQVITIPFSDICELVLNMTKTNREKFNQVRPLKSVFGAKNDMALFLIDILKTDKKYKDLKDSAFDKKDNPLFNHVLSEFFEYNMDFFANHKGIDYLDQIIKYLNRLKQYVNNKIH